MSACFVREAIAADIEKVFIKKMYGVDNPKDLAKWPSTISRIRFSEGIFSDYLQSIDAAARDRGTVTLQRDRSGGIIQMGAMLDNHHAASPGYVSAVGGIDIVSPLCQGIPLGSSSRHQL